MAADTGVTEPKGREERRRGGDNTGGVMEDNQRGGPLLGGCVPCCPFHLSLCDGGMACGGKVPMKRRRSPSIPLFYRHRIIILIGPSLPSEHRLGH
ncbi:hypothetical protein EYF80_060026 [Liparis tanakae]|uniref:Uncharacterized protein n=1 Tax=Liparis tanakae TaxID=230148 RepID=A0A4Z2EM33_9TELE|nr:hypothetical protein EYF80_060026 [Liparis tanakae]